MQPYVLISRAKRDEKYLTNIRENNFRLKLMFLIFRHLHYNFSHCSACIVSHYAYCPGALFVVMKNGRS